MTIVDDGHISLRLKHGIHTIYLFVDAQAPMSEVTQELLELLSDRYPEGLTTVTTPHKTIKIPTNPKLAYGILNMPNDPSRGWRRIQTGEDESSTPTACGLKNNSIVAFTFVSDLEDEHVLFEVEWPKEDDELDLYGIARAWSQLKALINGSQFGIFSHTSPPTPTLISLIEQGGEVKWNRLLFMAGNAVW